MTDKERATYAALDYVPVPPPFRVHMVSREARKADEIVGELADLRRRRQDLQRERTHLRGLVDRADAVLDEVSKQEQRLVIELNAAIDNHQ